MFNSQIISAKNTLKHVAKLALKYLVIITKDTNTLSSFVTIGTYKYHSRYKYLYLGHETIVVNIFKISFCIRKSLPDLLTKSGLIIIKDYELANKIRDQVIMQPNFIEQEIALPNTLEEYLQEITSKLRQTIKKIKKTGFTYSISTDNDWFEQFYNCYYVPSMVGRHAEDAYVMAKDEIMDLLNLPGTEFLNVFLSGVCIASAIAIHEGDKYIYTKVGWLNGDNYYLDQGVNTAIYQLLIERAFELGCKKISLGGTPPFLENGVLKFKAKWQSRFCADIYYSENYLLLDPSNSSCYEFLSKNSLVVFDLNNILIVLSNKLIEDTQVQGNCLDDISGWFLLRSERTEIYPNGMENLPVQLRNWYDKIY
ncbi:MAG: GNAT family N-acetyltransferase [Bacteroidota bacterium]